MGQCPRGRLSAVRSTLGARGLTLSSVELEFAGEVIEWRGPAPYRFIPLFADAAEVVDEVKASVAYWGVVPVTVWIGDTEFTTSMFPRRGHVLPAGEGRRAQDRGLRPGRRGGGPAQRRAVRQPMDQVEVEGLRIAYEQAGRGPPVVFLQGFVGDGRSTWSDQIAALSEQVTVIAWDPPGAGGSSDPPERFSIADYADCLAEFLQALGLPQGHLVGLSFGGIVALGVAEQHAEVPLSLGLLGAYAGWRRIASTRGGRRPATTLPSAVAAVP